MPARWDKPTEESEQTDTKVLAKTRPYLKATDTVLDYGCAKGSVDLKLAAAVKAIHGIDISSKMIACCKRGGRCARGRQCVFRESHDIRRKPRA